MDYTITHKILQISSISSKICCFHFLFQPSILKPCLNRPLFVSNFLLNSSTPYSISLFSNASNGNRFVSNVFPDPKTFFISNHPKFNPHYAALKSSTSAERVAYHSLSVSNINFIEPNQESIAAPISNEDVIEKLQGSLESKFGIPVTANGTKNIETLFALEAKPHQIRRIFASNSRFFQEPIIHTQLHSKISIFSEFGMNASVALKAMSKNSQWLLATDEQITSTLRYLERELAVTNMSKVVCNSPDILSLTATELHSSVSNLSAFALCDIHSAVERNPGILNCEKEEMRKRIETVQGIVGAINAVHLIELHPTLVFARPEAMLALRDEFRNRFGPNLAKEILQRHPKLLSERFENVRETVDGMIGKFGAEPTAHMILSCPVFVKRKWDCLRKKIEYVVQEMGREKEEVRDWPPVLALSLQKRLVARNEALRKAKKKHPNLKLRFMFACNDTEFCRRFGVELPADKQVRITLPARSLIQRQQCSYLLVSSSAPLLLPFLLLLLPFGFCLVLVLG